MTPESPLAKLAVETIEHYLKTGRKLTAPAIEGLKQVKAGVFVSLKKRGSLRGCIGTFRPSAENILEETIENAISAAVKDPRFPPVNESELPELECSVDVLSEPEPVSDIAGLDAQKYGVIVQSGWKRGLLLPRLEGVSTVEEQIAIARQKAGIGPDEKCKIFRFSVERHF